MNISDVSFLMLRVTGSDSLRVGTIFVDNVKFSVRLVHQEYFRWKTIDVCRNKL